MQQLSQPGQEALAGIARRNGFSLEAARVMFGAVSHGHGGMAQFDHPEFGGAGQWMRGGMTMVGNMFDDALKARVAALCAELAELVAREPGIKSEASEQVEAAADSQSGSWWPAGLPAPNSTGSQNGVRYAYFAAARRLAIEKNGERSVYDTLDHQISGVSQQQSNASTLRFTSQRGVVNLDDLPFADVGGTALQREPQR